MAAAAVARWWAALVFLTVALNGGESVARYLRWEEVQETVALYADSGLPGAAIQDGSAWNEWIRTRDAEVRMRVDRGIEDSISNFILYGTSFTRLPRVASVEYATSESGELTPATEARLHALALALVVQAASQAPNPPANERVRFVSDFLVRKGIAKEAVDGYLAANLQRLVAEQAAYQKKLKEADGAADSTAVLQARGTLFETRGLSADASLLPNFALEEALRAMVRKGVLPAGSMKRIAIIGPGLDFADKRAGYDFYPLQTMQPFAVWEAVARLGLGKVEDVQVSCLDLNDAVIAHIKKLAGQGRAGRAYTIQLARDPKADWSEPAVAYWNHFGELLGTPVKPLPAPAALGGVVARAVAIRPALAAHVQVYDANVVAQTFDFAAGQGFDLVIATNVLVYYDHFQQALALANIARLLNAGGIFLCNNVLPAQHVNELEYLGRRSMAYTPSGAYGDDVVVYRKR